MSRKTIEKGVRDDWFANFRQLGNSPECQLLSVGVEMVMFKIHPDVDNKRILIYGYKFIPVLIH